MGFERRPLEELVEDILDRRGVTPTKLGGEFVSSGHRVISAKLIKGGRIVLDADEPRFVNSEMYARWMKTPLKCGDVIMTSEAPLGELAYLDESADWVLGQRLFAIRPRKGVIRGRFLYYALASPVVRDAIFSRASGSTVQGIRQAELRKVKVPVPPISVQLKVESLLGALDERIDSLRKSSTVCEAIAKALFKSWFVDFDPVRSKVEGREPEGVDAATAALFPSEWENSRLGPIPKGWRVSEFGEAFEINPRRALPTGRVAKYLDMASVATSGHVPAMPIDRAYTSGSRFQNGDTLLARITPCLENGKTAHVDFLGDNEVGWGSTEFIVLRPRAPLPVYFGYLLARLDSFRTHAVQSMTGSSGRQRVDIDRLKQFPLALPSDQVAECFKRVVEPLRESILANAGRAKVLADLRDALLPRLISGKIRLPEARREIEAVIS